MGETWETREIPEHLAGAAEKARHALIDVVSNFDDNVMERYVSEQEITPDDLPQGDRVATIASELVPVLCGSAFKNKAVQPMLDAVVELLAEPSRRAATVASSPGAETRSSGTPDDEAVLVPGVQDLSDPSWAS